MRYSSQQRAWPVAALLLCLQGPLAAENLTLQDVRHWSVQGVTRVAVQLSGQAEVRRDRLSKPERYFFDFQETHTSRRGLQTIPVNDALVKQIRIGEARPGVARVVLDLSSEAEVTTTELTNPYRLMIEVRKPGSAPGPAEPEPVITSAAPPKPPPPAPVRQAKQEKPEKKFRPFVPPPTRAAVLTAELLPAAPVLTVPVRNYRIISLPQPQKYTFPPYRVVSARAARQSTPVVSRISETAKVAPPPPIIETPPPPPAVTRGTPAQAARRGTGGGNSMTRALGLKIRRVVIDPGHGGHDQGSSGPTGLLEKELVLDVALRLGELITNSLGSEVIYTRTDDHFIPLEARPKVANDNHADLFVSIHANSSTIKSVSGVETYVLSFTSSKEALDVASRENATSERSVFELRDLLQKIALQEKVEESRDFATRVNAALHKGWGSPTARNRGVKKAPFVVLIGASMPCILTEIGFLSNPNDEKELRKPETRQKIAEGLFKGIEQYADSLSHFAVARRAQDNE